MKIRLATNDDLAAILEIYNQGIDDRIATLETEKKDMDYITNWFETKKDRYSVFVAEELQRITGWASINIYNSRSAYNGVGEISVYIHRDYRGKGIGKALLSTLEKHATENNFHKLVLFTFPFNKLGQSLYRRMGYREVGVFKNQGVLDGLFVDVMAMEKVFNVADQNK